MDSPTTDPALAAAMAATLPSPSTSKMSSFLSKPSLKEQMALLDAASDDEEDLRRTAAALIEETRPRAQLEATSSELSTLASDFSNANEGDETVPTSPMVSAAEQESQSPVVKSTARNNKRRRVVTGSSDEEDLPDAADLTVKQASPEPEPEKKKKKSKSRSSSGGSINAAQPNDAFEEAEIDSDQDMLSKKKKSKKPKMKSLTKAQLAETNATTAEMKRQSSARIEPGAKRMRLISEITGKFKSNNPPSQTSQKAPRPSNKAITISSSAAPPSTALEKHAEHAADDDETQNPHIWLESQSQSQTCHITRKPSSPIENTTSPATRDMDLDDFDLPDAGMVSKKVIAAKSAAARQTQSDSDSDIEIIHSVPAPVKAKPVRPDARAELLNWTKGRASSARASVPPSSAMTETQFVKAGTTYGAPTKRSKTALPFSGSTTATIRKPTAPTNGSVNLNASLQERARKQGALDRAKRQAEFEARGGVGRKVIEAATSAADAKEAITRLKTEAKVVEEEEEDDDDYDPTTVEDLEMQYSGSDQEREAGSGSESEGEGEGSDAEEEKTEPAQSPVKNDEADTSVDFESFNQRKTLAGLRDEESTFIESAPKMPVVDERPMGHFVAHEDQQIGGFSQGFSQLFDDAPPATFAGDVFQQMATQAVIKKGNFPEYKVPEETRGLVDDQAVVAFNEMPVDVARDTMFVNAQGLLTQQRPADDVYSQAATQDPAAAGPGSPPRTVPGFSDSEDSDTEAKQPAQSPAGSSSGTRRPLQQVVDSDSEAEEETEPAQIVKGTLPAALDASTSTLAQPVPADAFAMMAKAQASGAKKSAKSKGKRSAFVNDQAHESDEDERYGGFMTSSKNQEDDKDDGSDLDQNLEELVDDQKVDEEVQHEQDLLAGERYQEQVAEDDAKLQKRVQKDATGAWRSKRGADGILDDSDYSDDEYGQSKRRQGKQKKRKIEGDQMEAIANNEETQAFAREYHTSHNPEDKDVDFLQEATQAEADETDEDDAPVETITRKEAQEQIQLLIQKQKAGIPITIPEGPSSDRSPESRPLIRDRTMSRVVPRAAANAWTRDDHFDDIDAAYKQHAPEDTPYMRNLRTKEATEASQSRGSMGKSGGAKSSVTSYATKATKRSAPTKSMSAPAVFPSKSKGPSGAVSLPKSKGLATSRSASFAK